GRAPTATYTLSLHDALPTSRDQPGEQRERLVRAAPPLLEGHADRVPRGAAVHLAAGPDTEDDPVAAHLLEGRDLLRRPRDGPQRDRKSTRLNSSHVKISYAV